MQTAASSKRLDTRNLRAERGMGLPVSSLTAGFQCRQFLASLFIAHGFRPAFQNQRPNLLANRRPFFRINPHFANVIAVSA